MNHSMKAALLSALIFPGVGQISVGLKKRGLIFIAITMLLLFLIIREIVQKASPLIAEMTKNGSAMDFATISNTAAKLSGFSDNILLNSLLILFVISWIYSVFDAYLSGLKISNYNC